MRRVVIIVLLSLIVYGPSKLLAHEKSLSEKPHRTTVRLQEYRFEPTTITLKTGRPAELILVNDGISMHEFITDGLKDLDVDLEIDGVSAETRGVVELEIPPGAKVVLRFTPRKPGEFPITCHAKDPKDHLKEGMIGKLVFR
jgi:uncharacterized cupredoxin-like copper-binding protein